MKPHIPLSWRYSGVSGRIGSSSHILIYGYGPCAGYGDDVTAGKRGPKGPKSPLGGDYDREGLSWVWTLYCKDSRRKGEYDVTLLDRF